jgi:AcrR family transcriptional regulator
VNNSTGTRRRRAVSDQDKSQRRDEIMAAAKKVFARKGFHATTIADIAKEAGLAYGSIYWYFDSKDELFHALMAVEEYALRTHLAVALAADTAQRDSGEAPFRAAVQATFEFFEADKATVKLLFRDAYALGDRFEKHLGGIYERFVGDIESIVVAAQQHGEVVVAPPRMIAYTLAALIGQLAHRRLSTDDGVTAAEVADFVVMLVLNGLRPRDTSATLPREGVGLRPSGGVPPSGAAPRPTSSSDGKS